MSYHLTVINPFGKYGRGAHITDAAEIAAAKQSNPHDVVQRHPDEHHQTGAFYRTDAELADNAPIQQSSPPVVTPSTYSDE